jgi:hypothetical protein
MILLYVAGKFRGPTAWDVELNIRNAEAVALELWRAGAAVICPHANTRFFDGAAPDEVFLNGDLEIVSRCDGIVMVPGWQASQGARAERAFAVQSGLEIFDSKEEALLWISLQRAKAGAESF